MKVRTKIDKLFNGNGWDTLAELQELITTAVENIKSAAMPPLRSERSVPVPRGVAMPILLSSLVALPQMEVEEHLKYRWCDMVLRCLEAQKEGRHRIMFDDSDMNAVLAAESELRRLGIKRFLLAEMQE